LMAHANGRQAMIGFMTLRRRKNEKVITIQSQAEGGDG